jgi:hypothetical protein
MADTHMCACKVKGGLLWCYSTHLATNARFNIYSAVAGMALIPQKASSLLLHTAILTLCQPDSCNEPMSLSPYVA